MEKRCLQMHEMSTRSGDDGNRSVDAENSLECG
jgi:hypothetical protein